MKISVIFRYGNGGVWKGKEINGKIQNYVNERTVNYIIKYVTKLDLKHKHYKPIILCSPGLGNNYTNRQDSVKNKFNGTDTITTYRTSTGHKVNMPIYWRNKIYTEEEREKLWLISLDKMERWVRGERVSIKNGIDEYLELRNYYREENKRLGYGWVDDGTNWQGTIKPQYPALVADNWSYVNNNTPRQVSPAVVTFPLSEIDDMREAILVASTSNTAFNVNAQGLKPYMWVLDGYNKLQTQEGLGLKTYQSDLFNNWLSTEWIDGTNGINEITAVDTSGGSFTIDTLNLSKKVYDMLNRIAVSGGTYDDWLDAVYTTDRIQRAESPMYMGGLIRELVFQEVISIAEHHLMVALNPWVHWVAEVY